MKMRRIQMTWVIFLLVVFAAVSSAIAPYNGTGTFKAQRIVKEIEKDVGIIEGFTEQKQEQEQTNSECPDSLIREGGTYYLFNTKEPRVPGVNPIQFESLNEYREYVRWQRSQGKRCSVLQLQHSHTVGGVKRQKGYMAIGGYTPQDVQQRRESMIRFNREHTQLCGEGSTIDPRFCMKEDFEEHNRGPAIVNGQYVTQLDGVVPNRRNGAFPYDPMNQYIGVRTRVDD